jgi:hypothetical protein
MPLCPLCAVCPGSAGQFGHSAQNAQSRHIRLIRNVRFPWPVSVLPHMSFCNYKRTCPTCRFVIWTCPICRLFRKICEITKGHFRAKFCGICPICGKSLDPPNLPYYMRIIQARRVRFARIFRKCPPDSRRVARHISICPDLSAFQNVRFVVNISGQNGHNRHNTKRPTFCFGHFGHIRIFHHISGQNYHAISA